MVHANVWFPRLVLVALVAVGLAACDGEPPTAPVVEQLPSIEGPADRYIYDDEGRIIGFISVRQKACC